MAARSEPRSGTAAASPPRRRGRYFTIPQAAQAYPGVLTERLIRRLVAERRVAYSYAGRRVVLAEADIEAYLDANRHEPLPRQRGSMRMSRLSPTARTAQSRPA
jgi:hypothetical protein